MQALKVLYAGIYLLGFLAGLPKWGFDLCLHKKYRHSLLQRFGKGIPALHKRQRPLVWLHAVSMGETRAIAPLAKKIQALPQKPLLVISSITETGHAEAKRSIPDADAWIFMPFDFYPIIHKVVQRLKPDLVIVSETDLWFQFLSSCRQQGAAIALVNAKLSSRSCGRWKKASFLSKPLFAQIDHYCVQDLQHAERFQSLGIPVERLTVTGNMKLDGLAEPLKASELLSWRKQLNVKDNAEILVAGSTHDPEEKILSEAWAQVRLKNRNLKLVIVPRHPERFESVYQQLLDLPVKVRRYSQLLPGEEWDLLVVDAMGLLQRFYQIATLAFVGGSYQPKVGGHSLIEPCQYGIPVLYGPYTYTQINLREAIESYGAGICVKEEQLASEIELLLADPNRCFQYGTAGQKLIRESQGATEKTFQEILKLIDGRSAWQNNPFF